MSAPRSTDADVDIDPVIAPDSGAAAQPDSDSPTDDPALTTSEDAQREDLPVRPGNS